MTNENIQKKLIILAVSIVAVCIEISVSETGKQIARYLLKCGTSPSSYFHKTSGKGFSNLPVMERNMSRILADLNDTLVWLILVKKINLLSEARILPVLEECSLLIELLSDGLNDSIQKYCIS